MSAHNDPNEHHNQEPESSRITARPILAFLGILAVATIAAFIFIKVLIYIFDRMDAASQPQPSTGIALPEGQRKLPPEPRLQGAPGPTGPSLLPLDEMKEYQKQIKLKAAGYGWVNKETGVAYIPIERAKQMVLDRGLPVLPESYAQDLEKAAAARKLILSADSNAGRTIK